MLWTIYTYGNGDIIAQILQGIALLVNGATATYGTFMQVGALLGLVGLLGSWAFSGKFPGQVAIAIVLLMVFSTQFKVDVWVEDEVNPLIAPVFVPNVPMMVALPAYITGTIGWRVTNLMEGVLGVTPIFRISNNSLNRAWFDMQKTLDVTLEDSDLRKNLDEYLKRCLIPMVSIDLVPKATIQESTNLLIDIGLAGNPAFSGYRFVNGQRAGAPVPCDTYYTTLLLPQFVEANPAYGAALRRFRTLIQADPNLVGDHVTILNPIMFSLGFTQLVDQLIETVIIRQGILSAERSLSVETFDTAGTVNLNQEALTQQLKGMGYLASVTGQKAVVIIRTLAEGVIYIMGPFLVVLAFGVGINRWLGSYLRLFVWLQLWSPLLVVLNFVFFWEGVERLPDIATPFSGINMVNFEGFSEHLAILNSNAANMMMTVPLIAWGAVSMFSGGLGSLLSAAHGAVATAESIGKDFGTGQGKVLREGEHYVGTSVDVGGGQTGRLSAPSGMMMAHQTGANEILHSDGSKTVFERGGNVRHSGSGGNFVTNGDGKLMHGSRASMMVGADGKEHLVQETIGDGGIIKRDAVEHNGITGRNEPRTTFVDSMSGEVLSDKSEFKTGTDFGGSLTQTTVTGNDGSTSLKTAYEGPAIDFSTGERFQVVANTSLPIPKGKNRPEPGALNAGTINAVDQDTGFSGAAILRGASSEGLPVYEQVAGNRHQGVGTKKLEGGTVVDGFENDGTRVSRVAGNVEGVLLGPDGEALHTGIFGVEQIITEKDGEKSTAGAMFTVAGQGFRGHGSLVGTEGHVVGASQDRNIGADQPGFLGLPTKFTRSVDDFGNSRYSFRTEGSTKVTMNNGSRVSSGEGPNAEIETLRREASMAIVSQGHLKEGKSPTDPDLQDSDFVQTTTSARLIEGGGTTAPAAVDGIIQFSDDNDTATFVAGHSDSTFSDKSIEKRLVTEATSAGNREGDPTHTLKRRGLEVSQTNSVEGFFRVGDLFKDAPNPDQIAHGNAQYDPASGDLVSASLSNGLQANLVDQERGALKIFATRDGKTVLTEGKYGFRQESGHIERNLAAHDINVGYGLLAAYHKVRGDTYDPLETTDNERKFLAAVGIGSAGLGALYQGALFNRLMGLSKAGGAVAGGGGLRAMGMMARGAVPVAVAGAVAYGAYKGGEAIAEQLKEVPGIQTMSLEEFRQALSAPAQESPVNQGGSSVGNNAESSRAVPGTSGSSPVGGGGSGESVSGLGIGVNTAAMFAKNGVNFRDVSPEITKIYPVINDVYEEFGHHAVITSGKDGQHMGGSKHQEGDAIDLRSNNMPDQMQDQVAGALGKRLGPSYDVVSEHDKENPGNDHIHVEYDPKGSLGASSGEDRFVRPVSFEGGSSTLPHDFSLGEEHSSWRVGRDFTGGDQGVHDLQRGGQDASVYLSGSMASGEGGSLAIDKARSKVGEEGNVEFFMSGLGMRDGTEIPVTVQDLRVLPETNGGNSIEKVGEPVSYIGIVDNKFLSIDHQLRPGANYADVTIPDKYAGGRSGKFHFAFSTPKRDEFPEPRQGFSEATPSYIPK